MGKLRTLAVAIVLAMGFSASADAQGPGATTAPAVSPATPAAKIPPKGAWNRIAGNWKQFKGRIQEKWGRLTKNDIAVARGNREALVGIIQKRYGISKEEAEKQVSDWLWQMSP